MQEPSAYQFDRHNAYWKADGTRGAPLEDFYDLKKYDDEAAEGAPLVGGGRKKRVSVDSDMRLTNMVNSVWLADGIHHQISDGHMDQLPDRYDPSSFRDKVTWFGALCISGLGMFLEAYIIITIGQVKTIWEAEYPTCWAPDTKQHCPNLIDCCDLFPNTPIFPNGTCAVDPDPRECNADGTYKSNLLCNPGIDNSLSYTEFAGIMIGMLVFGKVADLIGRVRAGMATSLLMVIGLIFITFYDSDNLSQQFIIISAFLGVVGIGIGGEYPLTAMGASANHAEEVEDALMDDEERARHRVLVDMARTARRGETISLVFAMQGVGTVFGSAYLLFLIYFSRNLHVDCDPNTGNNSSGNDAYALDTVWRSFFLIGGTFCVMLMLYRSLVEEEGTGHEQLMRRIERRQEKLGGKSKSTWKILKFYAPRLFGTGGSWLVLNVAFYGLKLFSGPIFSAINPGGDLIVQNGYLLVYNLVGMVGYYVSVIMDIPAIGRFRFQLFGFAGCALLFYLTAAFFNSSSPQVLMFLYFLGNFMSSLVNSTVHVIAAETFPTELRGTCYGISAFAGKVGALGATVAFGFVDTTTIFYICGTVSVIGIIFTYIFVCDLTRVSLAEHDAQLELFLEGRPHEYKGKLNERKHLTNFEIWTGKHGDYDPNWAQKLVEKEKEEIISRSVFCEVPEGDEAEESNALDASAPQKEENKDGEE